jgi:hypothetical protein
MRSRIVNFDFDKASCLSADLSARCDCAKQLRPSSQLPKLRSATALIAPLSPSGCCVWRLLVQLHRRRLPRLHRFSALSFSSLRWRPRSLSRLPVPLATWSSARPIPDFCRPTQPPALTVHCPGSRLLCQSRPRSYFHPPPHMPGT